MAENLKTCLVCECSDINRNVFLTGSLKVGDFYYLECANCHYHSGYFLLSDEEDMCKQWNARPQIEETKLKSPNTAMLPCCEEFVNSEYQYCPWCGAHVPGHYSARQQ